MSTFVADVTAFVKVAAPANRSVPGSVFKACAQLAVTPEDMCPLFINSCLMLVAAAPSASRDVSRFLTASDVASLAKGQKLIGMKTSEEIIRHARKMMVDRNVPRQDGVTILGNLRISLAGKVLGKLNNLKDKTLQQIASAFYEDLKKVSGHQKLEENPWAVKVGDGEEDCDDDDKNVCDVNQRSSSAAAGPVTSDMVDYDDDGVVRGVGATSLASKGFVAGCAVKLNNQERYQIVSIEGDGKVQVRMVQYDGSMTGAATYTYSEFVNAFSLAKAEHTSLYKFPEQSPRRSEAWRLHEHRCEVMISAGMIFRDIQELEVDCRDHPRKWVWAKINYRKRSR